jgi:signal transduction histidine kinase
MRTPGTSRGRVWYVVMIAALLSLLPLAWFQFQWIGKISQAERERLQADLDKSVSRFTDDFDSGLDRLFRALLFGPAGSPEAEFENLPARYARLNEVGADDRLVRDIYATRGGPDGTDELVKLDRVSGRLVQTEWPGVFERFRRPGGFLEADDRRFQTPSPLIDEQITALRIPWLRPPFPNLTGQPADGANRPSPGGWYIVELDVEYIRNEILPALVRRHFAGAGQLEYDVRIVSTGQPGRVIYSSTPSLPADTFDTVDAQATFLQVRRGPRAELPSGPPQGSLGGRGVGPPQRRVPDAPGGWVLQVVHRGGSLDALVSQTRGRNLAVSFGVLVVLAVSLVVLLVSTRRAQRLATLQMDFVAGVSHELRTPLSVIRSAGENLADGLVAGDEQVRRYGAVVRDEGRRLSHMVEQILGFAGMQSGRASDDFRPVDVRQVIANALAASEPEIRASGCAVQTEVPPDLPMMVADATSLAHCLRNLLDNAVTHGVEGGWVGIRARSVGAGKQQQVEIRVEDRGRGIDPHDAPHLFNPFYRGRLSVRNQVRGFGLGLTLARRIVEAHSGTLQAEAAPGGGACFVIRLPVLPEIAASVDQNEVAGDRDNGETNSACRG